MEGTYGPGLSPGYYLGGIAISLGTTYTTVPYLCIAYPIEFYDLPRFKIYKTTSAAHPTKAPSRSHILVIHPHHRFFRSLHRRQRGNSSIFSPDLLRTYISTRSLYRPSHKNKGKSRLSNNLSDLLCFFLGCSHPINEQTSPVPFPPSSSQTLIIEPKTVNDTIKSSSSRQKPEHALPATSARSLTRTSL